MNKKTKVIIIAIIIIVIPIILYMVLNGKVSFDEDQGIVLISDGAGWTDDQHHEIQHGLVNAVGKYTEAILLTNSVFYTDIENTDYEVWHQRVEDAVSTWQELEAIESELRKVLKEVDVAGKKIKKITPPI